MSAKDNIKKLGETDVWSLLLFALYQIKDVPELSSLSELVYIVDKDSLLNLCEYYGGETIRIPTIDELSLLLRTLLLYKHTTFDKMSIQEAIEELRLSVKNKESVLSCYDKMSEVLNKYEFTPRSN